MSKSLQLLPYLMLIAVLAEAQNTVGLLSHNEDLSAKGYTLIYPFSQPNVYLLNNCGEIAHQWPDDAAFVPGNSAYLLENSNLLKTKKVRIDTSSNISAGGEGEIVELRNWDNDLLWSFSLNNDTLRLHHDVEPMPNGNILMIAWAAKSRDDAIAAGRDSNKLGETFWPDVILEVDPQQDSVVWQWHAWDHLVQDHDTLKANFGSVNAHPELIDINFDTDMDPDWMHANAIDYHPDLDQIMLCVSYFNEIWIIDHSTSIEEASSHQGGRSNKGGDLLYRWGNPQSYRNGVPEDQQLFFPHNAHWIRELLDERHPSFNKIAVFNNLIGSNFSAANVLDPPWNAANVQYDMNGTSWGPITYAATVTHPEPSSLFSNGLSSVQFLDNENILLTSGRQGYLVELNPNYEIVWEYRIPLFNGNPVEQGDSLPNNVNLIFNTTKYPLTYPAFVRKTIGGRVWLEKNPDTLACTLVTSIEDRDLRQMQVYPNPVTDFLTVLMDGQNKPLTIFTSWGQIVTQSHTDLHGKAIIQTKNWQPGVYYIHMDGHQMRKLIKP